MSRRFSLSSRQQQVLNLFDQGLGRSGVAKQLGISESTVRTLVVKIKEGLRVPEGGDIALMLQRARTAGLLPHRPSRPKAGPPHNNRKA